VILPAGGAVVSDIVCTLPSRQPLTFLNRVSFYKITGSSKKIIVKANYTDEAISCLLMCKRHKQSRTCFVDCNVPSGDIMRHVHNARTASISMLMLSLCPNDHKLNHRKRCVESDDIKSQRYVTEDHQQLEHSVSYNWYQQRV
jgi:hypothetical protein